MESLKNIVFDFGGVLIDWNPIYLYRDIFDTEEEMNHFLANVCRYDWNILQDAGRSLAEGTRILQAQHPEYREEIAMYYGSWDKMLGGTIEENIKLIKPLKEKYKVYGLTNWSAETIPIAMERYDFFKDLNGMVVSGAEKVIKPDPRLYHILLGRYEIQAGESLFIDDNYANIETAQQLGFQTIHLVDDANLEEILKAKAIL
ncbi:HAD family phosphatase [Proteiniphilum sp.]|uniref:HAD family hydrolase n=1 Tax=Proteiniphilum sp. TaxID=1926877 RepID=UPI0033236BA0